MKFAVIAGWEKLLWLQRKQSEMWEELKSSKKKQKKTNNKKN